MSRITAAEVAGLKAKATPGPFLLRDGYICHRSVSDDQSFGLAIPLAETFGENADDNAALFVRAHDMAVLIAEQAAEIERTRNAYEGAREDLLDWKRRAQVAEAEIERLKAEQPKAEPVAIIIGGINAKGAIIGWRRKANALLEGTLLYTAQPAPAVPDDVAAAARHFKAEGGHIGGLGASRAANILWDYINGVLAAAPELKS